MTTFLFLVLFTAGAVVAAYKFVPAFKALADTCLAKLRS